ncbi:MAG: ATP-binding protein [Gemmatimonadales bacterium]
MSPPSRLRIQVQGGEPLRLRLDVPSDVEYVGEAVDLVARHCLTGTLSPRRVLFNLRTALAEALTNAIVYGNGEDAAKLVRVQVELGQDAIRIRVSDDGDGFDPSAPPDPTAPENLAREDGRGLYVMRHLVDRVDFNDKGNTICLTLQAG